MEVDTLKSDKRLALVRNHLLRSDTPQENKSKFLKFNPEFSSSVTIQADFTPKLIFSK